MTTLEDKILGEKQQYYCSSSEDEDDKQDDDPNGDEGQDPSGPVTHCMKPGGASGSGNPQRWDGISKNTGPKGVLEDWYLFQKHEAQMRQNKDRELVTMVQQTSLTCAPTSEGIPGIEDLESDDILQDFIKQRMEAMLRSQGQRNQFNGVEELCSPDDYLKLIDNNDSDVVTVVHLYENTVSQCVKMNECLDSISLEYRHIKFCRMKGTIAGVSNLFKVEGVPALLVYRGGDLIGNFIRLKEEFGHDFYAGDVENYLIENGILNAKR